MLYRERPNFRAVGRPMTAVNDLDEYGNPNDGSRVINCSFPDCGCDGARHCPAENGAHDGALVLTLEKRTPRDKQAQREQP